MNTRIENNNHTLISPQTIEGVVQQVVYQFRPERIILFGSYAYGQPHSHSDVDLLVVMETPLKETEQAVRICQAIDYHFGLDLMVRTPATLARRLALGDVFLGEIINKGKVLYERIEAKHSQAQEATVIPQTANASPLQSIDPEGTETQHEYLYARNWDYQTLRHES